jgi:1,2-diacylglycerol 3-alpha-glucosyltransferase
MTVLEAIGCGLPPLIADSPKSATKQFALDNRSLFPGNDIQKLSEQIDYWVDHPAELREAGIRYHASSQKYRIEHSYNKLIEIYRNAAGSGKT